MTTREEIAERLIHIMKDASFKEVDWTTVTDGFVLSELGFDSLSVLDLIYEVQQEFNLKFDAEDLVGADTFGDLVEFLHSRLK